MKDPTKKPAKKKDFARINSVKMGGGPHGGNIGPHKCKGCDTIIRTRECPFCGKR
jgi:hypothetical protein